MSDADILARTIAGEARGEGDLGMQAVANVVMNRVANPCWWGSTVTDVCLHPYQFSCWNKDDPNLPIIEAMGNSNPVYHEALDIAQKVIAGQLLDITHGATHYRAIGTTASWDVDNKLTPCSIIGHHEFFKGIQ